MYFEKVKPMKKVPRITGTRAREKKITQKVYLKNRVANPDPGSGIGKKSGSEFGMNNPDHISESLETI